MRKYRWYSVYAGPLYSVEGVWLKFGPVSFVLYRNFSAERRWRLIASWMTLGWYKIDRGY